jgi:glycosyltransferase involved in cell wall biosynthesis
LIKAPLVSIIVVTHNNQDDIIDCINSVLDQNYPSFEVIIIDNASTVLLFYIRPGKQIKFDKFTIS